MGAAGFGAAATDGAAGFGAAGLGGAGLGAVGLGTSAFAGSLPGSAGSLPGSAGSLPGSAGSLPGSSSAVPMPCRALSSFRRRSSSRPSAWSASSDTEEAYRRTPCVLAAAAGRGRTPERIRSAGVSTRDAGRTEETDAEETEAAASRASTVSAPAASTLCSAAADTDSDTPGSDAPDSGRGEAPPRARCVAAAIRARGLEATGRTPCFTETSPEPRPFAPRPSDSAGRGTTRPNQPR